MPKINVYLPDDLAEAVRDAQIPVSAVCQAALERAVREVSALRGDEAVAGGPRSGAFARYTPRARRAVELADELARRHGHGRVGTEHLVLGIVAEGGNLALGVLASLDVDPADLGAEVEGVMASGPAEPPSGCGDSALPMSPDMKRALELASKQAAKLGHNYIGCEHLLLGLVAEPEGVGGQVLRRMGLELRATRRAVVAALAGFVQSRSASPARSDDPIQQILQRLEKLERKLGA
ncbi:MAG TPA: Clp protease N-terminal domain-containing protein [Acidimicrobiales bacterium]|nr:Clp protease N-terminal domain-containing protein [Acidimicrobiales bacterium]